MPDVWLRYIRVAEAIARRRIQPRSDRPPPTDVVDLLLTPWSGVRPGEIAKRLRDRLADEPMQHATARVAISDTRVVAGANFDVLVRHVVPLSGWWAKSLKPPANAAKTETTKRFEKAYGGVMDDLGTGRRNELARYLALVGFIDLVRAAASMDAIWRLAALAHRLGPPPEDDEIELDELPQDTSTTDAEPPDAVPAMEELELYKRAWELLSSTKDLNTLDEKGIYLTSLNRPASQSLFESRATVKADAAQRVFDINTTGIVFAVIDGGIDASHPAFLARKDEDTKKFIEGKKDGAISREECLAHSRVKRTYDFTLLRDIVARVTNPEAVPGPNSAAVELLLNDKSHEEALKHLRNPSVNGRDLDWEVVSPLIRVAHQGPIVTDGDGTEPQDRSGYHVPGTDHGTHVAGILAADLPKDADSGRELNGMCPQLWLYDLRVFDADGHGDEFAILCALEFVGWLNRDRANPVVHGVNLSLALAHDVDSFACGQTPICEACNHLVGAGTVVVAAAGNTGFEGGGPEKQSFGNGYRPISITDPGNADNVITVGSTHRRDPHLYGVSYFSARGPTGDGRRKPDLLAPGEKITSTIRDGRSQRMDGTSMAAPHVAGAAAMLMARYPELIGRPLRIKEILMQTTTDLKRETSFQGAGLLDVLRALQSV